MRRVFFEILVLSILAIVLWAPSLQATAGPTNNNASVVITAMPAYTPSPSSSPGTGGAPLLLTPKPATPLPKGTISLEGIVNQEGVFTQNISIESEGEWVCLFIPAEIVGMINKTSTPQQISIVRVEKPLHLPLDDADIIGDIYDLGPSGLRFNDSISITLSYEDSWVPPGINENDLYIAVNEGQTDKWEQLLNSQVDTAANKITATVDHFSYFTILAAKNLVPLQISELQITPLEVNSGEIVNISILVSNTNGSCVKQSISPIIDGQAEDEQIVTLEASESVRTTFYVSRQEEGTYTINIGELIGTFTVNHASKEARTDFKSTEPVESDNSKGPIITPTFEDTPALEEVPDVQSRPSGGVSLVWYVIPIVAIIGVAIVSWRYLRRKWHQNTADTISNDNP